MTSDGWHQPPPPAPQPAPPPGYGYGYGAPSAYGQAVPSPAYHRAPATEGLATASLLLSIAAWVTCLPPLAFVSLALAGAAQTRIDGAGGQLVGMNLVRPARLIAWANVGLWALILAAVSVTMITRLVGVPS